MSHDPDVIITNVEDHNGDMRFVISLSSDKAMEMAIYPRELYRLKKLMETHIKSMLNRSRARERTDDSS